MAVKVILRMGNPILAQKSAPVALSELSSPQFRQLLTDMFDTMQDAKGAGLAAPQIGILKQVIIFGGKPTPRYPDRPTIPTTVLINPHIAPLSTTKENDFEACLSVPGLKGWVPRYTRIRYSGYTERGELTCVEASGFHARVVQHEVDHLWGILYPQRIENYNYFGFFDQDFHPAKAT